MPVAIDPKDPWHIVSTQEMYTNETDWLKDITCEKYYAKNYSM